MRRKRKSFWQFNFLLFLLILIVGTRCSYNLEDETPPKNLIPKETFSLILKDVMILESYYKVKHGDGQFAEKPLIEAIQPIFEKHQIDSLRFSNSMNYYASQQELLKEIYLDIQDRLMLETAGF